MSKFLVERYLPGLTPEQLGAAASAAKATTTSMTSEGTPVRYLRSTFIPGEDKCYCLFEGASSEAVAEVQRRAGLPYEKIHEAAFLTAEDV